MSHDPLCPQEEICDCCLLREEACYCDLIAKVREDERANVTAEFMSNHGGRWEYEAGVAAGRAEALGIRVREVMPYANGYFDGEDHMLAKCIKAVEAIDDGGDADTRYILASTAATLRDLQEKDK